MNNCPICEAVLLEKNDLVFCSPCSIFWSRQDDFYKISNFFKTPSFYALGNVRKGTAEEACLAVILFLFLSTVVIFA